MHARVSALRARADNNIGARCARDRQVLLTVGEDKRTAAVHGTMMYL
jgi:hypothetical protein